MKTIKFYNTETHIWEMRHYYSDKDFQMAFAELNNNATAIRITVEGDPYLK